MQLTLKRIARRDTYTIGRLYIDGVYQCDTLEDKDRLLTQNMSINSIYARKVKGSTAIPTGTYRVDVNTPSPKYSNFNRYSWAKQYNGCLPRLVSVPGFTGILIHVGNTSADTEGCILVGKNTSVGRVNDSIATFHRLMAVLRSCNEPITITVE